MALSVLELIKRGRGGVKGTVLDFHNLVRNALTTWLRYFSNPGIAVISVITLGQLV